MMMLTRPGKLVLGEAHMIYSWEGRKLVSPKSNGEYLTLSADCIINWVPHDSGNPLPAGVVIGGL